MKGTDWVILGAVAVLCVLLGALAFSTNTVQKVETIKEVPVIVTQPANSTNQEEAAILTLKDSKWEDSALALAVDDLEAKSYKDLYNFLVDSNVFIDVKEDISKVVIKDSDVSDIDADEQDATVDLELKVYFEDLNGETVKKYVDVTCDIADNDVTDCVYSLA